MASSIVKAKPGASQRTKNRINENGPLFILGREMPDVSVGGELVMARLVYSVRTDWVGWLPAKELLYEEAV